MASGFGVEPTQLKSLAEDLGRSVDSMTSAQREMESAGGGQTGESALDKACGEFQHKWGYGLKQLGTTTHALAAGLEATAAAYLAVEEAVAKAFSGLAPGGAAAGGAAGGAGGGGEGGGPKMTAPHIIGPRYTGPELGADGGAGGGAGGGDPVTQGPNPPGSPGSPLGDGGQTTITAPAPQPGQRQHFTSTDPRTS